MSEYNTSTGVSGSGRSWVRTLIVIVAIAAAMAIGVVMFRNSLVAKREAVSSGWAQIDNVLKRRIDLIPNLVQSVKGYAKHESAVFESVAEARTKLMQANGVQEKAAADAASMVAVRGVLALAEKYPQLRAVESFNRLMDELAGTENRISVERKRYNDAVRNYNTSVKGFPGSLFASSFPPAEYYNPPEDRAVLDHAPKVEF